MEILYVNCPKCNRSFHCDANLLGLHIPLHCPHCDLYFEQGVRKERHPPRGTASMGLSRINRKVVYVPPHEKRKSEKE